MKRVDDGAGVTGYHDRTSPNTAQFKAWIWWVVAAVALAAVYFILL